ncbi:MAG: ROK family protein [Micrococcales bacterium]|nr:ROK family protein [Micrococcales bacterium]
MSRAYVGVDVGGTNIKSVVLVDRDGEPAVLAADEVATRGATPEQILAQVAQVARQQAVGYPGIAGLGFCLPGAVDRVRGVVGVMPNLPGEWHGRAVCDAVAADAGLPAAVVNDARAFTLAESRLGAGRGLHTVVGVTLGTGLGGGVAIGGVLHEGASGFAGDLGHQVIEVDGRPCRCGSRGCAETVVSSLALTTATGLPTVKEVFAAAAHGEPVAAGAVDRYLRYLAVALANVHTLLCPDAFVIGGGIAAAWDQLAPPLLARMKALVTFDHPENVHLRRARLGSSAGAIGAGLLARAAFGAEETEETG